MKRRTIDNSKIITQILSLVTLCVSIHYFFSLFFLVKYLASFDLSFINILSFDDIQFVMALYNIKLFIILGLFIIGIPIAWETMSAENRRKIRSVKVPNYIIFLFVLIDIILLYLMTIFPSSWFSLLFSGITSIAVLYFSKNQLLSIVCFVVLIFAFVYYEVGNITNHNPLFNNYVKFELSNDKIITSDNKDHRLIFWGTKYVILQNGKNNVKLYPTSEIREVEWSKLVIQQTD